MKFRVMIVFLFNNTTMVEEYNGYSKQRARNIERPVDESCFKKFPE